MNLCIDIYVHIQYICAYIYIYLGVHIIGKQSKSEGTQQSLGEFKVATMRSFRQRKTGDGLDDMTGMVCNTHIATK